MGAYANAFGPHAADATYVPHSFDEQLFDTGEVELNHVVAGEPGSPALLLIPGQTESWWGYEAAIPLLAEHFHVHAVDLRGQGRSTRTPGRYTLDNMGNDLVRFIDGVIGRPTDRRRSLVRRCPVRLAVGLRPARARWSARTTRIRPCSRRRSGRWSGRASARASGRCSPTWRSTSATSGPSATGTAWSPRSRPNSRRTCSSSPRSSGSATRRRRPLKEYDPEWGRAFWTGSVSAACPHDVMLRAVKVPVLFTHHFRMVDEASGALMGAISDLQVDRVRQLVTEAGNTFEYHSFPSDGPFDARPGPTALRRHAGCVGANVARGRP